MAETNEVEGKGEKGGGTEKKGGRGRKGNRREKSGRWWILKWGGERGFAVPESLGNHPSRFGGAICCAGGWIPRGISDFLNLGSLNKHLNTLYFTF
jgi:hypothetical protein